MGLGTAIFILGIAWLLIAYPGFRVIVFWLTVAAVAGLAILLHNLGNAEMKRKRLSAKQQEFLEQRRKVDGFIEYLMTDPEARTTIEDLAKQARRNRKRKAKK